MYDQARGMRTTHRTVPGQQPGTVRRFTPSGRQALNLYDPALAR